MQPSSPIRRVFLTAAVFSVASCATDSKVDHEVMVRNAGKDEIVDFSYTYGSLGRRSTRRLGMAGEAIITTMQVPESVLVEWTNESNGARHAYAIPLRSVVSAWVAQGKIIRFDIAGHTVAVYLVTRLPAFQETAQRVYAAPQPSRQ